MGLFSWCGSESPDIASMCEMDVINIGSTTIACILFIIVITYVLITNKKRCRTLLYLHNARSMVQLILILANIFELVESYISANITPNENISISPLQITCAWLSFLATLKLIVFARVCELYDKAGFLFLSILCQILVSVTKIYKVILLTDVLDLNDLRPVLIECTIVCSMLLVLLDSYTIYIESSMTTVMKTASPNDKNVGYKHSQATFLSKITFYWLTPLFWRGYQDPLELGDLGTLHERDTCRTHYDRFQFTYLSKTTSLWCCYMKIHWKMFIYGGLLKLLGDLAALVGPISITKIVDYIDIRLNATATMQTQYVRDHVTHMANALTTFDNFTTASTVPGTHSTNFADGTRMGSTNNYNLPLSLPSIDYRLSANANQMTSIQSLVDENTEIFYATWPQFIANGWVMAALVLMATLAQATLSQASTHIVNMIGIRLRTSLQSLVYRKTLLISLSTFQSPSIGVANAMANDADCINGYRTNGSLSIDDENGDNQTANTTNNRETTPKITKTDSNDSGDGKTSQSPDEQTFLDTGKITNLMAEDALNVMSFFWIAHYVWAIPLKIGFVMCFLYQMLGISAIIGSTVCIVTMIPLQFLIGKKMSNNAKLTATSTDERLQHISELLMGIKIIKLNAWEKVFAEKIQRSRDNELKCLNKDSIYWTIMTFLTHLSSVVITFVTIAVFFTIETKEEIQKFSTGRVFAALALFNQLTVPLFIFPITIPIIISAIVSTRRLEEFLHRPEVQKSFEGIRNMARVMSRSDASLDVFEIDENDGQTIDKQSKPTETVDDKHSNDNETYPLSRKSIPTLYEHASAFNTMHNDFTFNNSYLLQDIYENGIRMEQQANDAAQKTHRRGSLNASIRLKKNSQLSASIRLDRNRPRQKSISTEIQIEIPNELILSIRNGIFSWKSNGLECTLPLRVDRLDIPKGKLTVIVGRSGSGKTSVLAAILKEMRLVSGELIWNKFATIAYVQQTPWLMKTTIKENILFGEAYRHRRYEKVLIACALNEDLEDLPDGDSTEIDPSGLNLSGGQKQRIAIARALYSSANVIIMDDPLSSLDNEVSKSIFDNSIKNMLLKHQRTVILVTQKTYLVHSSDYIIAMENNRVRAKGTYRVIESKDYELIQKWNAIIAKENAKDESIDTNKVVKDRFKVPGKLYRKGSQYYNHHESEVPSSFAYNSSKRKPSVYGSRHLTYDIPFPIDECNTDDIEIRRRPSKRHPNQSLFERMSFKKAPIRSNSLDIRQQKPNRIPIARNISSPSTMQQYSNNNRHSHFDVMRNFDFRQFISRMSFKRKNTNLSRNNSRMSRPMSAKNSIGSAIMSMDNSRPAKRMMSTISKYSEEAEEDEIRSDYNEEISDRLIYDEERKYGKIPTEIYLLYLKSCGLWTIGVFCASAFTWQAMKIYLDVWLKDWTDIEQAKRFTDVSYYFGVYGLLSVICIAFSMISTPFGQYGGCKARCTLHEQLLQSIIQKSIYFFQTTPFGQIMNRFSSDMAVIDKKIAATSQRLLQFILLCLCSIALNAIVTPWFVLLSLPICAVYYLVQKFYRYSSRELHRMENITISPILSHFAETIQGVATIRAYNQESRFMEMLFKRMEANNITVIMQNASNRWLGIALDYLGGIIVFVAIITALFTVQYYPDGVSASTVALAINYTLLVPIYLNWVVKLLSDMEMYIGAVERISHYIDRQNSKAPADNDIDENPTELMAPRSEAKYKPVPITWPQRGDITFENVTLRYENHKENIVTNLNLVIPAGQRLGICGRSGSGKSTIAMSLFRVVDIVSGHIAIDDVNIATIHTDEIRTRLSVIPQCEKILFNGTIRENLDPRNHYTDLDLWNSLEMAQLKQTIIALPAALETIILDNGNNVFSAGEKQLFCLARAVLRGSVCLILDEATSSLDGVTESALLEAANKAFQGRTIITIAHRLTTLLNYDRIIVIEHGNIVEDGTPDELRHKVGGKFSSMLYSSVQSNLYYTPEEKL